MRKLYKIYKQNIYGVIGTLVFHILLLSAFLIADIDKKGTVNEEELLIEFPDFPKEEELFTEKEKNNSEELTTNDASSLNSEYSNNRTNIASNKLAKTDNFFNEDYLNEIQNAKNLVSEVNQQLSKEIIDINDIEMPIQTTEGMNPDSIHNMIYSGESNIVYYLENRHHLQLPIPVYLTQGGGKIIVDIIVNRQGKVIKAETRNNPSIKDEQIYLYAKAAASRTIFNVDTKAPNNQSGTIHYTFIPQ